MKTYLKIDLDSLNEKKIFRYDKKFKGGGGDRYKQKKNSKNYFFFFS
jgi:hypothetical protein